MMKTAKVKKKLRLDELIKYVIDKGLNSFQFTSDNNVDVYFSSNGYFLIAGDGSGDGGSRSFDLSDAFTVEVEEPITDDTIFERTISLQKNFELLKGHNQSVTRLKKEYPEALEHHAVINGKLQLIWEEK